MIRLGLLAAVMGVSACETSGLNAEKDALCGAQLGAPCTTIQQADGTQGALQPFKTYAATQRDQQNAQLSQKRLAGTPATGGKTKVAGQTASVASGAPDGGTPYYVQSYRVPEKLGTLWVAPYLGQDGIFREATHLHFVVRPGSWRGQAGQS